MEEELDSYFSYLQVLTKGLANQQLYNIMGLKNQEGYDTFLNILFKLQKLKFNWFYDPSKLNTVINGKILITLLLASLLCLSDEEFFSKIFFDDDFITHHLNPIVADYFEQAFKLCILYRSNKLGKLQFTISCADFSIDIANIKSDPYMS